MNMNTLEDLRDSLWTELEKIAREKTINATNLEHIYKLTDSIKNTYKIEMLENGGYSEAAEWSAGGNYGNESSYANRGQHYVRGHYSHDDGYSGRRDSRRRCSRADGRSGMIEHLRDMMDDADNDKDREAIRRCLKQIEEG